MRYIDQFRKDRAEHPERYRRDETLPEAERRIEPAMAPTGLARDDLAKYHRDYMRLRRATLRGRKSHIESLLKTNCGITVEQYTAAYERQRGKCAICGKGIVRAYDAALPAGKRGPRPHGAHVDHDHACCPGRRACGRCFRGLLCSHCNHGLGYFRDSARLLISAADYVAKV